MDRHTPRTRDAALRRLKSINRWLIAGSAALTGLFAAVAANAFPGRSIKSTSGTAATHARGDSTGGRSGSASGHSSPTKTQSGATPRPPAQAPESSEGFESERSEAEPSAEPTQPTETTEPSEATKPAETTEPTEAARPAEAQPEAPVVSGGS